MTEEVAKVAPEIKARSIDEDDASMFSNHSEEKCSYRYRNILVSVHFTFNIQIYFLYTNQIASFLSFLHKLPPQAYKLVDHKVLNNYSE